MIYLSAGHHFNPNGADPGALGNGYKEADLTKDLRDLIAAYLRRIQAPFILDKDEETLSQYIARIKPGGGSVLCEIHFNAAASATAGTETLVKSGAKQEEKQLAADICQAVVDTCGLKNRGVKTEADSHRGRLGVLHTAAGISVLPEICFITSKEDMDKYQKGKYQLAAKIGQLLVKYDKIHE